MNEADFDRADGQRRNHEQAYFLYLFTRFEAAVNDALAKLLAARTDPALPWADRRVWQAIRTERGREAPFLSRVEVLLDKSRGDFSRIHELYTGRNAIAHGGNYSVAVDEVARQMDAIARRFAVT